jgi:hypothetical protein
MHFFLQIDPDRPIGANYLVRADSGIGRHVSAGIGKTNIGWIVENSVLCPLERRSGKLPEKSLPCFRTPWQGPKLRRKDDHTNQGEQRYPTAHLPATLHLQGLTPDSLPGFPEILLVM